MSEAPDPEEAKKAYLAMRELPDTDGKAFIEIEDEDETGNITPVSAEVLTEIQEAIIRAIFNK